MDRKYSIRVLSRRNSALYDSIMKRPWRRGMLYGGKELRLDYAYGIDALKSAVEMFSRRGEPTDSLPLDEAIAQIASSTCWIGEDRSKRQPPLFKINQAYGMVTNASLLTSSESARWRNGKVPSDIAQNMRRRYKQASQRKRERNAALLRLISYACLVTLCIPYDAMRSRKTEHRRIEIAHPTLHLAVTTLNHLGHTSNRSTAELIRFDSSQWIIHDTLREVMESQDKRLQQIATMRLRRVAKYTVHAMPTLLTEHNKRKS